MNELRYNIARMLPHELRTPLTIANGYADLLLADSKNLAPEHVAMLKSLNYGIARLNQLTERFLLYSELELRAGQESESTDMPAENPRDILQVIAQEIATTVGRQADLVVTMRELPVHFEKHHLVVLLRELVSNGFKFSDAGTPVEVLASVQGELLTIAVTDLGRGMTAQQIAQIDAFVQFDRKFWEQQGTGLGLILVKRVAQLYGGSLAIESEPGKTTTASVTVPLNYSIQSSRPH